MGSGRENGQMYTDYEIVVLNNIDNKKYIAISYNVYNLLDMNLR
jgi:hypothetical protein